MQRQTGGHSLQRTRSDAGQWPGPTAFRFQPRIGPRRSKDRASDTSWRPAHLSVSQSDRAGPKLLPVHELQLGRAAFPSGHDRKGGTFARLPRMQRQTGRHSLQRTRSDAGRARRSKDRASDTSRRLAHLPVSQSDRARPELLPVHELQLDALLFRLATTAREGRSPAFQGCSGKPAGIAFRGPAVMRVNGQGLPPSGFNLGPIPAVRKTVPVIPHGAPPTCRYRRATAPDRNSCRSTSSS